MSWGQIIQGPKGLEEGLRSHGMMLSKGMAAPLVRVVYNAVFSILLAQPRLQSLTFIPGVEAFPGSSREGFVIKV